MKISSARPICFSPTGTTKKIVEGIAEGFQAVKIECLDLPPLGMEFLKRRCRRIIQPLMLR